MALIIKSFMLLVMTTGALSSSYCPSTCLCEDNKLLVRCDEGALDVLPIALNPSIDRLIIKFNKIKIVDFSIQFYTELRMLDLSYNELISIQKQIFIYQAKLLQLHLNHNKISEINIDTFKGLISLEVLNLRGNYIVELTNSIFAAVPAVEELNLGQNRIATIHPDAFKGLSKLKSLYLDDNILTTMPTISFKHIQLLAELFIGVNAFNVLPNDAFRNLQQLARLDLHGTLLTNISSAAFYRLKNLRLLDISDNQLQKVPTSQLGFLTRLEALKIGQNNFEILQEGSFFGLSNLQKIDISGCKNLKQIQSGAFVNANLDSIVISSNKKLTEIHDGVFSDLPNIKNVELKNNGLKLLPEQLLPWKSLKSFDISGNPLHCDCQMRWLQNFPDQDVICHSPQQFEGELLQDIPKDTLGCENETIQSRTYFGLLLMVVPVLLVLCLRAIYINRSFLLMKFSKTPWINEADCSFDGQHHIYEEISIKHNDSINSIMSQENLTNSNIYSFSCPYQMPSVPAQTASYIYSPTSVYGQQYSYLQQNYQPSPLT